MDYRIELEKAKESFELERYKATTDACMEIIEGTDDESIKKEAFLLIAKAFLWFISDFEEKDSINMVAGTMSRAVERAESLKEVYEIEYDYTKEFRKRKLHHMEKVLKIIENNCDDLKNKNCFILYSNQDYALTLFDVYVSSAINGNAVVKMMREKENLTLDEASKKYSKEVPDIHEELSPKFCQVAVNIYNKMKNVVEANKNTVAEVCLKVCSMGEAMMYNADACLKEALRGTKDEYAVMTMRSEIIDYALNTMLHPSGGQMSLIGSANRNRYWNILKEIYERMKELNPDFEVPPMPEKEGIAYQPPVTTSTSGGGCYVATAVYGSYDCPQVWTLRRFRDYTLDVSWYGRLFIKVYYAVSPTLVKWFGETNWFKNLWKKPLDKLVENLKNKGVEDTPYNDKY